MGTDSGDLGAGLARMISTRSSLTDLRARNPSAAEAAEARAVAEASDALGREAEEILLWFRQPPWLLSAAEFADAAAAYAHLAEALGDA